MYKLTAHYVEVVVLVVVIGEFNLPLSTYYN
jgi:hypothetical protein